MTSNNELGLIMLLPLIIKAVLLVGIGWLVIEIITILFLGGRDDGGGDE